ncbi:MAG: PPK2 family polyphosphate:nucleotide phosphotransferase [Saprospiraceae bacterium]|jgi:PPK2 family polyphosphate:nucleotide phosphotransferase
MIKLSEIPTTPPDGLDKKEIRKKTRDLAKRIGDLQELMYAENKQSLLVVLQGMDSSGKDGATRNVFSYCSPAGTSFYAFKKPTDEEFSHDFLWRVHRQAPRKGEIKIFNRSHYEDILIQRVHGWIDEKHVSNRINSINALEELLQYDNKTTILKFYMHLSYERQGEKLQERIDEPGKNWKHNPGDWKERKLWDKYRDCYEDAINRSKIPWHIVPVDSRSYRDYVIASKVAETLENLNMKLPELKKE